MLTDRQTEICKTIIELTENKGFSPTYQEIATALGLKNRSGIVQHLERLRKKGYVTWIRGDRRTLTVINKDV